MGKLKEILDCVMKNRLILEENEMKLRDITRLENKLEEKDDMVTELTLALCNKYPKGLFIYSQDCMIPIVIRNGKVITNELTRCFDLSWDSGEIPVINIEQ